MSVLSPSAHPCFTSFFPISISLGEDLRACGSLAGNEEGHGAGRAAIPPSPSILSTEVQQPWSSFSPHFSSCQGLLLQPRQALRRPGIHLPDHPLHLRLHPGSRALTTNLLCAMLNGVPGSDSAYKMLLPQNNKTSSLWVVLQFGTGPSQPSDDSGGDRGGRVSLFRFVLSHLISFLGLL